MQHGFTVLILLLKKALSLSILVIGAARRSHHDRPPRACPPQLHNSRSRAAVLAAALEDKEREVARLQKEVDTAEDRFSFERLE